LVGGEESQIPTILDWFTDLSASVMRALESGHGSPPIDLISHVENMTALCRRQANDYRHLRQLNQLWV
jgi:hypothetical protein